MVLVPFAETKGTRRAGAKARFKKLLLYPRDQIPNQNLPIIQNFPKRPTALRWPHSFFQAFQSFFHALTRFVLT